MSYTKTQWVNDTAPALNETNLNKIEQGIYDNDSHIGDLTTLTTTADTDLVSAINEVDSHADTNATNIGDLTTLTTTADTDLVSAVNELDSLKATKDVATTSVNGLMSSTDKTKLTNNLNYPNATEVNTGITWFGSKPLYRKIVTGTISQSGSGTYPSINVYLDNPDFVMFRAFIYYSNGRYYADSYKIKPYYDKTNNVMVFNQPEVTGSVVIIFEYTKTTD